MLQVLNFRWRYEKEKYVPYVDLFDDVDQEVKRIELTNYSFNWQLSADRYCVGYSIDGEYHPCPTKTKLSKSSYERCFHCDNKVGFRAAFLFGQEPNENMKKYLSQPHLIYLAYFEPGMIKVGTAAGSRKMIRPIEQDALLYTYIAETPNADEAKRLERYISNTFNLTESVRSSHKKKFLGVRPSSESADSQLRSMYNKVTQKIDQDHELANHLLSSINIVDISANDQIYYPENQVLKTPTHIFLLGEFKGLRGKFLVLHNENDYLYDCKRLQGRRIEGYSDEGGLVFGAQIGLF